MTGSFPLASKCAAWILHRAGHCFGSTGTLRRPKFTHGAAHVLIHFSQSTHPSNGRGGAVGHGRSTMAEMPQAHVKLSKVKGDTTEMKRQQALRRQALLRTPKHGPQASSAPPSAKQLPQTGGSSEATSAFNSTLSNHWSQAGGRQKTDYLQYSLVLPPPSQMKKCVPVFRGDPNNCKPW